MDGLSLRRRREASIRHAPLQYRLGYGFFGLLAVNGFQQTGQYRFVIALDVGNRGSIYD